MKRPPEVNEPSISHYTVETGDRQVFAICDENFDPAVLKVIPKMTKEAIAGFRIFQTCRDRRTGRLHFMIQHSETEAFLTSNEVKVTSRNPLWIDLETSVLSANISPGVIEQLADLEQCAAIALVKRG